MVCIWQHQHLCGSRTVQGDTVHKLELTAMTAGITGRQGAISLWYNVPSLCFARGVRGGAGCGLSPPASRRACCCEPLVSRVMDWEPTGGGEHLPLGLSFQEGYAPFGLLLIPFTAVLQTPV